MTQNMINDDRDEYIGVLAGGLRAFTRACFSGFANADAGLGKQKKA